MTESNEPTEPVPTGPTESPEPASAEPVAAESVAAEPEHSEVASPVAETAAPGGRRFPGGRSTWFVAAAVLAVLAIGGVTAAVVSHHRTLEGRGWAMDEHHMDRSGRCGDDGGGSGDERRSDGRGSARCDLSHMTGMPDMMGGMPGVSGAAGGPNRGSTSGAAVPARPGDPNGPVVIEPNTPGGPRTVVWPDGRIVTIPQNTTAAAGAASPTSTPG